MVGLMYPLEPVASVRMTRNHEAILEGSGSLSDASSTTSR